MPSRFGDGRKNTNMKKVFALLLAAVMCLSFVACGGEGAASGTPGDQNDAPDETQMQFDAFYAEGKKTARNWSSVSLTQFRTV